ncbi:uncharacterized protein LOC110739421 [Chenopodium quinoa]|uniref:uncharacterized protein LOC110739421 n=1 Tax=Chenopodium quinoa TaxID=63459 RepID=UPI000B773A42|nr:uncharacterized protein LOC110739421 [Chenopodium quinoa]
MVWNVQGAGSREFIDALKEIIRVNKPNVIPLVETHMGGAQAIKIANIIEYNGHTRIDAQGFSGGIWIYWKKELVTVEPIHQHGQYITMNIKRMGEVPWYFTAVYASPDPSKRQELWRELKEFASTHNMPWVIAGDFNDTRFQWERSSDCPETTRRSARFNEWVEDMGLLEVEFSGASHTWFRGKNVDTWQSARLDRAICNSDWSLRFPNASVKHLPAIQSDHTPILIAPNGFAPIADINRPFRFQAAWMTHENFRDFVESKWKKDAPLMPQLHSMAEELQQWNKTIFHNIFKKKRNLLARIAGVQRALALQKARDLIKLESKLRGELDEVLAQEELLWYQKSRVDWIKDGDRNTTFFQLSTIARRWRNKISAIREAPNGEWITGKTEVQANIVSYFQKLFECDNTPFNENLPRDIFPEFTTAAWHNLTRPFLKCESIG